MLAKQDALRSFSEERLPPCSMYLIESIPLAGVAQFG